MRLSSWFPCTTTLVFFWFLFDHRKFIDPEDRRSNTGFPWTFLHFSPFCSPPHDSLSYLIFQSLDYLFCFLHPHGSSSPAYVLCWCPFLFLFCLSSQFILFPLKVPHSSSSQWPFFSSSPPYFLLVHPLRPLSLLAHHIRHPSLILDADHPSPNVLLISDTWSTISSDIWHRHHLSFSYVRFISYLLTPLIWSRPARSVLLTTWSEGRIIDRITAFSPNYQC